MQQLTIFKGKAVQQSQAIKPVVVPGVPYGVHPWAISEQYPLQPRGQLPCK